jgi:hypothetical protein
MAATIQGQPQGVHDVERLMPNSSPHTTWW